MKLSELIYQLKTKADWHERQAIAQQIVIYGDDAIQPLINILGEFVEDDDYFLDGKDVTLHSIAEDALVAIGASAVNSLIPLLNSHNWGERFGAIYCLNHIGDMRAIEPMITALEN